MADAPLAQDTNPVTRHGQRIVSVDKVSGKDLLEAAERAWREREILFMGGGETIAGLAIDRHYSAGSGGGWHEGRFEADASPLLAQISTTSGTTGPPKALAISRRAISDVVARLVDAMEMDSSIREYVAVPVTFSFGLGRVRAVASLGGACFLPEDGFRPDEIARMLKRGEINALSAVPTMLRTLIAHPELIGAAGRKLRWLEIGSQYMSAGEKAAVRDLFPEARILQHYGLTEASRSSFLRIDREAGEALESVGRPHGEVRIRIGAQGHIEIAGPHLAEGIVADGSVHPLTQDGWLRTADLGEMRDGFLYFLGRADDVANIGGIKVSAEQFEQRLAAELGGSTDVAVAVMPDALRGQRIAVACQQENVAPVRAAAAAVAREFGLHPADMSFSAVAKIPRTATGKVRRSELARLLGEEPGTAPIGGTGSTRELTGRQVEIARLWQEALGVESVGPDDTFHDLGGDSLSAINVMIRAGQSGLPEEIMQRMFAGHTVAQIAAWLDGAETPAGDASPRAVRTDALNAVRGLLALLIVTSHWAPFFIERMGAVGAAIWSVAGPILRIGTPGFAVVYGLGLGMFFFNQLETGGKTLRRRIRSNTTLLVFGVLLIAAAQAWRLEATGAGFGPIWPEELFYEVLLFYALMVPTSLFWLRQVARFRDRIFASLVLAAGALLTYAGFSWLWPVNPFEGWASLGWHMLVAPYAYPRLLGATALGLAAALWLQDLPDNDGKPVAKLGACLTGFGFLMVAFIPGGWSAHAGSPVALMAFSGAVLLLLAGALQIVRMRGRPLPVRLLVICGLLAFPIFIGHGLVIPVEAVLEANGVAHLPAILLPASLFVVAMLWLGRRLYRMYFGTGSNS